MLESVKDKRIQKLLCERIQKLSVEPEKQGKELSGKLSGFRSVRAGSTELFTEQTIYELLLSVSDCVKERIVAIYTIG